MSSAIRHFSRRLADEKPYTGNIDQDTEVFAYGIKLLLLNATAIAGIMLMAWQLDTLKTTLLVWAAAQSLRIFAGGRHQSGPIKCWITTVIVFTLLGYVVTAAAPLISEYVLVIIALGFIFTLSTVIFHAPVTIASKQFAPGKRRKLKMGAVAMVVFWAAAALAPLNAIFDQPTVPLAITAGLVMQTLSLINFSQAKNLITEIMCSIRQDYF